MTSEKQQPDGRAHLVDIHVGNRVRERRKTIRVSQMELAAKIGVTFQQVQKYERGGNRISASKLYEIARTLEAPVSHFFDGLPTGAEGELPNPDAQIRAFLGTAEATDLAKAFLSLPTLTQKDRMLDLMKAMASGT